MKIASLLILMFSCVRVFAMCEGDALWNVQGEFTVKSVQREKIDCYQPKGEKLESGTTEVCAIQLTSKKGTEEIAGRGMLCDWKPGQKIEAKLSRVCCDTPSTRPRCEGRYDLSQVVCRLEAKIKRSFRDVDAFTVAIDGKKTSYKYESHNFVEVKSP